MVLVYEAIRGCVTLFRVGVGRLVNVQDSACALLCRIVSVVWGE